MTQNYDPTKRYTWTPEDKFELSGEEFGILLNSLRIMLNTQQAQETLALMKANDVIENLMTTAVNKGIVIEIIDKKLKEVQ